jgi:hypothetical protein
MELVTISKEFNDMEAQMKRAQLEAAGFHPFIANEASSLWIGTAYATGGILIQVPEDEVSDAREFLNSLAE